MADDQTTAPAIPSGFEKISIPEGFEPATPPAQPSPAIAPQRVPFPDEHDNDVSAEVQSQASARAEAYAAARAKAEQGTSFGAISTVVKQAFNFDEPLGMSDETRKSLSDAGLLNDYTKGDTSLLKDFNEIVLGGAAVMGDAAMRAVNAPLVLAHGLPGITPGTGEERAYNAQQFANDLPVVLAGLTEGRMQLPELGALPKLPPSMRQGVVVEPKPWQAEIAPAEETNPGSIGQPLEKPPVTNLPAPGSKEEPAGTLPATASDPIKHENPILDGSGNLNLDYITADKPVKDIMAQTAQAYADRFGTVQSHAETEESARSAFEDGLKDVTNGIPDVVADYMRGGRINTDDVWIGRQVNMQIAVQIGKLTRIANASGLPEDVTAAREMAERLVGLTDPARHEMAATAGRITNSFQIPIVDAETGMTDEAATKLASQKNVDDIMRIAGTLDTPQAVAKFVGDTQKPSWAEMGLYYVFNNWLSGPLTHAAYATSWAIETALRIGIDTPLAAGISKIQEKMGKTMEPDEANALRIERDSIADRLAEADSSQGRKLTAAESQKMESRLKEIHDRFNTATPIADHEFAARLIGMGEGALDTIRAGWKALKTADVQMLPGEMKKAEMAAKEAESAALQAGKTAEQAKKAGQRAYNENSISFGNPIADRGKWMQDNAKTKKGKAAGEMVERAGLVQGVPMRVISALHTMQRFSAYAESANAYAYRMAAQEGLAGGKLGETWAAMRDKKTELAQRMAVIKNNLSPEAMEKIKSEADHSALMERSGQFGRNFQTMANTNNWSRAAVPFSKVVTNLTAQKMLEKTPLGILSEVNRGKLLGAEGNAEQATAIARMARGTALLTGGAYLAAKGTSYGFGSDDKNERAFRKRMGEQPYSVDIGDINIPHRFFGTNGGSLSLGADIHDVNQWLSDNDKTWQDWTTVMGATIHYIGMDTLNENAVRGPEEMMNAIDNRENAAKYYVPNLIASAMVPFSSFQSQISHRYIDPIMRQTTGDDTADTIWQTIKDRSIISPTMQYAPSRSLIPQVDILGQPMLYHEDHTAAMNNPILSEMDRLGIFPSKMPMKLGHVELDEGQYYDLTVTAGRQLNQDLSLKINNPNWVKLSNQKQATQILTAVKVACAKARATVISLYPQIVKDNADDIQDLLHQYDDADR